MKTKYKFASLYKRLRQVPFSTGMLERKPHVLSVPTSAWDQPTLRLTLRTAHSRDLTHAPALSPGATSRADYVAASVAAQLRHPPPRWLIRFLSP